MKFFCMKLVVQVYVENIDKEQGYVEEEVCKKKLFKLGVISGWSIVVFVCVFVVLLFYFQYIIVIVIVVDRVMGDYCVECEGQLFVLFNDLDFNCWVILDFGKYVKV